MPRQSKPYLRKQTQSWYCSINGKQFPLGENKTQAFEKFFELMGSLGYKGTRKFGTTPVYRLDCRTWSIEPVKTQGESPGWIYKHKCKLEADRFLVVSGGSVCVERSGAEQLDDNHERFRLDLKTMKWARL